MIPKSDRQVAPARVCTTGPPHGRANSPGRTPVRQPRHTDSKQRLSEVKMKRTLITLGLATTLLTAFACERRGDGTGTADSGGPIKVGIYGDLSGQTSSFGQST